MVITSRTYTTLFANQTLAETSTASTGGLVRLPLSVVPHYETRCHITGAIIPTLNKPLFRTNLWSSDEHERFLHGLEMFPNGPWKEVAKIVGTKTTRQTMTHAQKYRQKIERRMQAKTKPKTKRTKSSPQKLEQVPIAASTNQYELEEQNLPYSTCLSFMNELLSEEPELLRSVTSPTDVDTDAFDTSFLDQEFDALLANLQPSLMAPVSGGNWTSINVLV